MGNTEKFADMLRMASIIEDCLNDADRKRYGHEVSHVTYGNSAKRTDSGDANTIDLAKKLQGLFTPDEQAELAAAFFGPLFTQDISVKNNAQEIDHDDDDVCTCDTCGCADIDTDNSDIEIDSEPYDDTVECDGDCALCLAQRSLSEVKALRDEVADVYDCLQDLRTDMAELKNMLKGMTEKNIKPATCDGPEKPKKPRKLCINKGPEMAKEPVEPIEEPIKAKKPRKPRVKKVADPVVKVDEESIKTKKPRKPRTKKIAE